MHETKTKEIALLIMVEVEKDYWSRKLLAEEFRNLVISTGIEVEDVIFMKLREINSALYIGKGKVEEFTTIVQEKNIDVVIFNNNLGSRQQRNLEDAFGVKTIDRTQLILDIFAKHARTQEGILQVELAQLEYLMPRLVGKGIALSRLGGGIGTRGPGEKKLETDRRKIADRITRFKKELQEVSQHRELMRKKRQKEKVNMCSLIGYTNAGKSTLFNALTESTERTSSGLFTTLDTVSRQFRVHKNLEVVISDTVGFLYKLPPHLIDAFRATLEELHYAQVLLHVIDASSEEIPRLQESVNSVLKELELSSKPAIIIFNKIDKLSEQDLTDLEKKYPDAVFISALNKTNIEALKEKIYESMFEDMVEVVLKFPFNLMEMVNFIHNNCQVLNINYKETEVVYHVKLKKHILLYLRGKGVSVKEI